MGAVAYLAWRHILFHKLRSATLVAVIATLVTIPLLTEVLTRTAEARMVARADATPMVFGASGAPLGLTLAAAYFRGATERPVTMSEYDWLLGMRRADLAPIQLAGTAQGFPVIGTDVDYFRLRGLELASGRAPVRVGEAVLGARAAEATGVTVGDFITTDVQQVFDLAGAYPVAMTVSGVLAPTGTPDDRAILTDLQTGWIVTGLGHGHEELTRQTNRALLLNSGEDGTVTANASLPTHETITPDTLSDFHFHGAPETFPISAVLVFPFSAKDSALIRGRVADREDAVQIVRARDQIRGLMDNVFQIKTVLQGILVAVSLAALLALALVVWLSVQMRRKEFTIAKRLGARAGHSVLLVGTELCLLTAIAIALSLTIVWVATWNEDALMNIWFSVGQ